jgi:hypothetical protein
MRENKGVKESWEEVGKIPITFVTRHRCGGLVGGAAAAKQRSKVCGFLFGGSPMSRREFTRTIDLMVRAWGPRVNEAALAFEARWTRRALRNHNPKLADAFEVALSDFDRAMTSGSSTDHRERRQRPGELQPAENRQLKPIRQGIGFYRLGRNLS